MGLAVSHKLWTGLKMQKRIRTEEVKAGGGPGSRVRAGNRPAETTPVRIRANQSSNGGFLKSVTSQMKGWQTPDLIVPADVALRLKHEPHYDAVTVHEGPPVVRP